MQDGDIATNPIAIGVAAGSRSLPDGKDMPKSRNLAATRPSPVRRKRAPYSAGTHRLTPELAAAMAKRVQMRQAELGFDTKEVATRAKISIAFVNRIRTMTELNPKIGSLNALAFALGRSLDWILGFGHHVELRTATIPLIRQAEVGVFRTEKPQQTSDIGDVKPLDPQRFVDNHRFGVLVADDSLGAIAPANGAVRIIGLVIAASPDMTVEDGRIYLIHRANSDGQIETSFRRAVVNHDSYEFVPLFADEAKNNRHRLVVPGKNLAASKVEIGGLFYASVAQHL